MRELYERTQSADASACLVATRDEFQSAELNSALVRLFEKVRAATRADRSSVSYVGALDYPARLELTVELAAPFGVCVRNLLPRSVDRGLRAVVRQFRARGRLSRLLAMRMSERPAKVLLLGATFDTGNMGVGALAASAVRVLHRKYGDGSIVLLDYAREARTQRVEVDDGVTSIEVVNMRFSWKIFLPNNILLLLVLAGVCRLSFPAMRRWIVKSNAWLTAIDSADVAFAISGGDSFSDIYGLERFFYVTLPQVLVALLGKKLVLLPQTIGPFKGAVPRRIAAALIRRATRVYSRDRPGVEIARGLARSNAGRVQFKYDLGFALEPRPPAAVKMLGPSFRSWQARRSSGSMSVGCS